MGNGRVRPSRVWVGVSVLAAAVLAAGGLAGAEPGFTPIVAIPTPASTGLINTYDYSSIACTSTTSCEAVGPPSTNDSPAAAPQPLAAATESSGTWSSLTIIGLPAGAATKSRLWPGLESMSCPTAGNCEAVGGFATTAVGAPAPMAASQTAGTWSSTATALPATTGAATGASQYDVLSSVQCPTIGNCVAAGTDRGTDGLLHAFVAVETAGVWAAGTQLPGISLLTAKDQYRTTSIECSTVANCTVIGDVIGLSASAYAWTESAGTWSSPVNIAPGARLFEGLSIACPDASTCIVVGAALPDAATVTETSGVWGAVHVVPAPRLAPVGAIGAFDSIACDTDAVCEATGEWLGAGFGLDLASGAATWSNGSWSTVGYVPVPLLKDALVSVDAVNDVVCPSTTSCDAVGFSSSVGLSGFNAEAYSTTITPVRPVTAPHAPFAAGGSGLPDGLLAQWLPPTDDGGAPVTTFTATIEPGNRTCTTTGYSCAIHGLSNGHRYHVIVTDTTSFGRSTPTVSPLVVAGEPPLSPTGVLATVVGKTAIQATWRASHTLAGEPVQAYMVTLMGPHHLMRHLGTKALSCMFGGLHPGEYLVSVAARNASGLSGPSRPAHVHVS